MAHSEEIVIERALGVVIAQAEATALEDAVGESASLPRVAGTYLLSPGRFGGPGSRRLVCLTDGSTLLEQVVALERTQDSHRFRYVVWGYTSPSTRPIAYGVGEFEHRAIGSDRTHVRWTYSFALRCDRFPGFLGPFGAWLFRVGFLERDYAVMMRNTLASAAR